MRLIVTVTSNTVISNCTHSYFPLTAPKLPFLKPLIIADVYDIFSTTGRPGCSVVEVTSTSHTAKPSSKPVGIILRNNDTVQPKINYIVRRIPPSL